MSGNLRPRILLWHKLLNQVSGQIVTAYGGKALSKEVLEGWKTRLRGVLEDMETVRDAESSQLDEGAYARLMSVGGDIGHRFKNEGGKNGPAGVKPSETGKKATKRKSSLEEIEPHPSVAPAKIGGGVKPLKKATRRAG